MDSGKGGEVGDDENPLARGERGYSGAGEVEVDPVGETNAVEVQGNRVAGVEEFDVFGKSVARGVIHDFADDEMELGIGRVAGVGGGVEEVALGVVQIESFREG